MLAVFSLVKDALDAAKHAATGTAPSTVQQCTLLSIPLFHVTATHAVLLPCFYFGRKMVIMCVQIALIRSGFDDWLDVSGTSGIHWRLCALWRNIV
jgi:hypothetical protein